MIGLPKYHNRQASLQVFQTMPTAHSPGNRSEDWESSLWELIVTNYNLKKRDIVHNEMYKQAILLLYNLICLLME